VSPATARSPVEPIDGRTGGRVADAWHGVQPLPDRIVRVTEQHVDPYAVGDIWLVRGAARSVAADAGSGIVPAGPFVEELSDTPVLAVALTCSYDHAGGWHSFTDRACHRLDAQELRCPQEADEIHDYLTPDMMSAIPSPDFRLDGYEMPGAEPTRLLDDGESIDLGDRELVVLHTPGRSPGGLCLWEEATATLFSGEILYDGDHGPAWPPEDPVAYCESLRRLARLPVETVHAGHYGSFDRARMTSLIEEQLADLADV
jgi:glyoxylase-like metal-dependent hydrolase (beta-lactamase superfamily II)